MMTLSLTGRNCVDFVGLQDLADSKRINGNVQGDSTNTTHHTLNGYGADISTLSATVLSALFWPQLPQEDIKLTPEVRSYERSSSTANEICSKVFKTALTLWFQHFCISAFGRLGEFFLSWDMLLSCWLRNVHYLFMSTPPNCCLFRWASRPVLNYTQTICMGCGWIIGWESQCLPYFLN